MEIIALHELSEELLKKFLLAEKGEKSIFSQLASSQTGNDRTVPAKRIEFILQSIDHLMFLAVKDGALVGMTVGQRVTGINNEYMYIHDVVVDTTIRGAGIGSGLVTALLEAGQKKWPEIVRFQLTSRPSRGTAPFFMKFGFRARTKESGDETIVYVKDVGDYAS